MTHTCSPYFSSLVCQVATFFFFLLMFLLVLCTVEHVMNLLLFPVGSTFVEVHVVMATPVGNAHRMCSTRELQVAYHV